MSVTISANYSSPSFTPETLTIMERVVPNLQRLREEVKVIEGRIPIVSKNYPGEPIFVGSFYMFRFDPKESGSWLLRIGSKDDPEINARIHTSPTSEGVACDMTIADKNDPRGFRNANPDEVSRITDLMDFVCSSALEDKK